MQATRVILIYLVRTYRVLSRFTCPSCRFEPTCSHYALSVLQNPHLSLFKGVFLICKRLLKCQPFHPGGYDPPPSVKECSCESLNKN